MSNKNNAEPYMSSKEIYWLYWVVDKTITYWLAAKPVTMMNHVHVTIERVRIGEYICYRILREYTDSTADDTTEN